VSNTIENSDEINLVDVIYELWRKKVFILIATLIVTMLAITYAFTLPNIYVSTALLSPTNNNSDNNSLSQYAGVASLAGISLQGDSDNKSLEAIERIKSYEFFSKFILPSLKLENITAVKKWEIESNKIIYDDERYDVKSNKWHTKNNKALKPSTQSAYKIFKTKIGVSRETKTGFVKISAEHHSPYIAQEWVQTVINQINKSMRDEDKLKATKSIEFLNSQTKKTNYAEVRQAISSLQEDQIKSLMLIESDSAYIFKILDSPIAPEVKSKPKRPLIAMIGMVLGLFLSSIYALIFYKKNSF
jgi:uncharacterized protein involved in exopolysaccharide biosynthesis